MSCFDLLNTRFPAFGIHQHVILFKHNLDIVGRCLPVSTTIHNTW